MSTKCDKIQIGEQRSFLFSITFGNVRLMWTLNRYRTTSILCMCIWWCALCKQHASTIMCYQFASTPKETEKDEEYTRHIHCNAILFSRPMVWRWWCALCARFIGINIRMEFRWKSAELKSRGQTLIIVVVGAKRSFVCYIYLRVLNFTAIHYFSIVRSIIMLKNVQLQHLFESAKNPPTHTHERAGSLPQNYSRQKQRTLKIHMCNVCMIYSVADITNPVNRRNRTCDEHECDAHRVSI